MVIEDDLTKLELFPVRKKALMVFELATNNFCGPLKLWEVKCVPSVTIKTKLNMSNLFKATSHRVENAYFDIVRISMWIIVSRFESHALEAQMLI